MAKKACKCKEVECEECPEWIFTFADLVMLMMGFFVILWVLKPAPSKDGEPPQALDLDVLAAIREAFGHVPAPDSTDPVDKYMLLKKLEQMKPLKGEGVQVHSDYNPTQPAFYDWALRTSANDGYVACTFFLCREKQNDLWAFDILLSLYVSYM